MQTDAGYHTFYVPSNKKKSDPDAFSEQQEMLLVVEPKMQYWSCRIPSALQTAPDHSALWSKPEQSSPEATGEKYISGGTTLSEPVLFYETAKRWH